MFDAAVLLLSSLWVSGVMAAGALFLEDARDQLIAIGISAIAFLPTIFAVIKVLVGD
jgi:hypothetical protein